MNLGRHADKTGSAFGEGIAVPLGAKTVVPRATCASTSRSSAVRNARRTSGSPNRWPRRCCDPGSWSSSDSRPSCASGKRRSRASAISSSRTWPAGSPPSAGSWRTKSSARRASRSAPSSSRSSASCRSWATLLKSRDAKLAEAQQAHADVVRKQRELEEKEREIELTIEKRVSANVGQIQQKARQDAEDQLKLKVAEKDQLIGSMQRQIEELRRKSEQGSQQLQGEALEAELHQVLTERFDHDTITRVQKGEFGGDVLHQVVSPSGLVCGSILWESKRTKNWSEGWLPKLRQDQRAAKAEVAVIVSQSLPKGVTHFGFVDGVYVVSPSCIAAGRDAAAECAARARCRAPGVGWA